MKILVVFLSIFFNCVSAQGIDGCFDEDQIFFGLKIPGKSEYSSHHLTSPEIAYNSHLIFNTAKNISLNVGNEIIDGNGHQMMIMILLNREKKEVVNHIITRKLTDGRFESCKFNPKTFAKEGCSSNLIDYLGVEARREILRQIGLENYLDDIEIELSSLIKDFRKPQGLKLKLLKKITIDDIEIPKNSVIDFGHSFHISKASFSIENEVEYFNEKFTAGTGKIDVREGKMSIVSMKLYLKDELQLDHGKIRAGSTVEYNRNSSLGNKVLIDNFNIGKFKEFSQFESLKQDAYIPFRLPFKSKESVGTLRDRLNKTISLVLEHGDGWESILVRMPFVYKGLRVEQGDIISNERSDGKFVKFYRGRRLWKYDHVSSLRFKNTTNDIGLDWVREIGIGKRIIGLENGNVVSDTDSESVRINNLLVSGSYRMRNDLFLYATLEPQRIAELNLKRPADLKMIDRRMNNVFNNVVYEIEINEKIYFDEVAYGPGSKLFFDPVKFKFWGVQSLNKKYFSYDQSYEVSLPKESIVILANSQEEVRKFETLVPLKLSEKLTLPANVVTSLSLADDEFSIEAYCPKKCLFNDKEYLGDITFSVRGGGVAETSFSDSCEHWGTIKHYREEVRNLEKEFSAK